MQRKRISVYLSLYSDLGILQPPMKYEERFFMPSIRITDCRVSGATRNEDWPDSCKVRRNEGMERCKMAKFQFNCPKCGRSVNADATWCGRDGECPYCGKGIVIPQNNTQSGNSRKGGRGGQVLTGAKAMVTTAWDKAVTLWNSGTKGMVLLCVPALLTLGVIVSLMCFQGNGTKTNDSLGQSSSSGEVPTSHQLPASQSWDMDSLRESHSKPMSTDQEVYNNLLYLYLSMQGNYSKYKNMKKKVYEFDHTRLSQDMKSFVSGFVSFLDKIGELERRIENCYDDREKERNDSSISSGFSGGFKAASTLSQFDSGGDDGFGATTYLLAGLIGGLIEASDNDAKINERYKRIVQEYREQENGLYIGFKQNVNKLRNSETFNGFDKNRLLSEDAFTSINNADSGKAWQLIQCKVPELSIAASFQVFSSGHLNETKKYIVACIANYPQSIANARKTDMSVCYSVLAQVVFRENVSNRFHYGKTDLNKAIESMSPTEFATISADPIAILDEAVKNDSGNDDAFGFRATLRFASGDYKNALADINTAIRINSKESYFYNKACILAKGFHDARGAKASIREAFKKGFCDIKELKSDKDLTILQNDPEFIEMTKVKYSWWYKPGVFYSEIFVKNESCFRLTNTRLVSSSSGWNWSLPESGTVTLEAGETFSKDWYDNPPSDVHASAKIFCDQNVTE